MIMLLRNIGHTPSDATASGGECFVASESVAKEFKRSAVGRREPTTPFRQYGRALSWGSGSLTRRLDAAVGRSGSCQNRNHHKLQDVRVAISPRSPQRR